MKITRQGDGLLQVSIPNPGVELLVSVKDENRVFALFDTEAGRIGPISEEAACILGYDEKQDPNRQPPLRLV